MMLVTKCPNCHTVFKVVSDQLKISEGWVRCGQCNEIFDTTLNLREWDPKKPEDNIPPSIVSHEGEQAWVPSAIEPADTFQQVIEEPESIAEPAVGSVAAEPSTVKDFRTVAQSKTDAALELPPFQTPHSGADNGESGEFSHPQIDSLSDGLVAEKRIDLDDGEADVQAATQSEDYLRGHSFTADLDQRTNPQDPLNFLNRESPQTLWESPLARRLLGIASVVLAFLLVGQFLIQERDRISTYIPSLRPVLDDLCHGLGCRVMPLRQIESMTVESSSFNRFRGETYRLSFVIRNSSDLELAKPALELTLTDSQDQPVYRRVLLPAELDPKSSTMTRGEEWSESLVISLADGNNPAQIGSSKSVAGYRLLAFYP
jgi:predicted Zn finger-like uncharacterized protein